MVLKRLRPETLASIHVGVSSSEPRGDFSIGTRKHHQNGRKKQDKSVHAILDTLRREYIPAHPAAQIDVYRYNPASIRMRIIDPGFVRKAMADRDDPVWDLLTSHLPEDTVAEIGLMVLLTPKEAKTSIMNVEFEDPTPAEL